jgi:hypothetical protein
MREVVIAYEHYIDETNDEVEIRDSRRLGPLYRFPSGETVRIPNSGFEKEGITFRLSGFGKRDRPVAGALPNEPINWLRKFLGPSYSFNFNDELRGALIAMLKDHEWSEIKKQIMAAHTEDVGRLQAVRKVLLEGQLGSQPESTVEVETVSDERLKELGLS